MLSYHKKIFLYIFIGCVALICISYISSLLSHALKRRSVDVLTYHYDNARTGANLQEKQLTLKNVNNSKFGLLFALLVDGNVYAQPLYKSSVKIPGKGTHNILIVATEHDSVYAFDADNGNFLWQKKFVTSDNLITTVPELDTGTNDIAPEVGITGTPVIDATTSTLYVVSKTKEVSNGTPLYKQQLHALDLGTGNEKFNGPTNITGIPGFDALKENQRAALLLTNGVVYIAWASHGDIGPYHGFVIGYQASDISKEVGIFNDTTNGDEGGIWMSGGGLASDGKNIYGASGNGTSTQESNYANSAFKLTQTASGLIPLQHFLANDRADRNTRDIDFGVAETLLLPDQQGAHTQELVTADKTGTLYLIDRNSMNLISTTSVKGSLHNNAAYYENKIYIGGNNTSLKAFSLVNGTLGKIVTQTQKAFGGPLWNGQGTNPIISAHGNKDAIIWTLDVSGTANKQPPILYAYNAHDLSQELYSSETEPNMSAIGSSIKFSAPVVANGYVYVPGSKGVAVFGLLQK